MADNPYDDDESNPLHSTDEGLELSDLQDEHPDTSGPTQTDEPEPRAEQSDELTDPAADEEAEDLSEAEYQELIEEKHEEYIKKAVEAIHVGNYTTKAGYDPMDDPMGYPDPTGICEVEVDDQRLYVVYEPQGGYIRVNDLSVDEPFAVERYLPNKKDVEEYLELNYDYLDNKSEAITEWLQNQVRRSVYPDFDEYEPSEIASLSGIGGRANRLRFVCPLTTPRANGIKQIDSDIGVKILLDHNFNNAVFVDEGDLPGLTIRLRISGSGYRDYLRTVVGAPADLKVPQLDWQKGHNKSYQMKKADDEMKDP